MKPKTLQLDEPTSARFLNERLLRDYPRLMLLAMVAVILAGIGMPIVWGVLGGSMPRSGGEYIYNSRIIHPVIGIAESFGNAFVWIMWIYVLEPWVADPGFTMLASFTG